ncbi:jg3478 [Pararge aegeria aegeria]|uniref:Jg3478 protein n=1 Tax=Pararge aegeria aegeria TaxID=348720 RepID=A0A8S4R8L7_9NEOP|nr:jg3478 [Pararge aegeria aegeria]
MQDRARICKYRHIYKRKGSPERRTNAALRGNQSGEIPSMSDRKMSNELPSPSHARVSDTRRGRHSTAALRLPPLCWYIYRLIIELVSITITRQLGKWQALKAGRGRAALPRLRSAVASQSALSAHAQPSDLISANPMLTCYYFKH